MSNGALEIKAISGHAGPVPGRDASRDYDVCKLIDVTTCIGCKACEVACLEWNGYPFRETVFDNTYQTMPDLAWNYYNLIRFNEHVAEDGTLSWLMRKDGCMHCADPGCLRACPADGAIVQYANGIVDFNQDNCIGCQYCVTGCPFNIPKFNHETKKVHKCTLCSDRVGAGLEPACIKACPTGCLHFGSKDDMVDLAGKRVQQLHEHTSHKSAGVYDPAGVGGTHVIYVLHDIDNPEHYGGLPKDPRVPLLVRIWKGPLKWVGNFAMVAGVVAAAAHFVRFGPKKVEEPTKEEVELNATAATHYVPPDAIQRYTFSERVMHWLNSITYTYCVATGLAFYTPHLFWLSVLLGGGPTSRFWHPIVGVGFFLAVIWMHVVWRREMEITETDKRFLSHVEDYATNRDERVPPQEKYNGGQKLYYWLMYYGTFVLLGSGLFLWFPEYIAFSVAWIRHVMVLLHEIAALVTIGGFIVHVYMSVFLVPGSMTAMTEGFVTRAWARTHHRLWYIRMTGGDPASKE